MPLMTLGLYFMIIFLVLKTCHVIPVCLLLALFLAGNAFAEDETVAAQHVRLKPGDAGAWQFTGLAETFVNDHLVSGGAINDGDRLRVGRSLMRFAASNGAELGESDLAKVSELHASYSAMREQLGKVIIGQGQIFSGVPECGF